MKKIVSVCIFTLPAILAAAGPETYDHMAAYKGFAAAESAPVSETVKAGGSEDEATARYTYNKKGLLTEAAYFINGRADGRSAYRYRDGRLVTETTYDRNGRVTERLKYSYNNEGKLSEYSLSDTGGNIIMRWVYRYRGGLLAEGRRYFENRLTEHFTVSQINSKHQRRILYSPEGKQIGVIDRYYRDGRLVKRIKSSKFLKRRVDYIYKNKRLQKIRFYESTESEKRTVKVHTLKYSVLTGEFSPADQSSRS